mmetsp:Transcript_138084/g.358653  ORF Transcript_138084/g.358653 Transcript_138084/m.358653 type:complete len:243 (+) Transcript_138084:436-1164(+)
MIQVARAQGQSQRSQVIRALAPMGSKAAFQLTDKCPAQIRRGVGWAHALVAEEPPGDVGIDDKYCPRGTQLREVTQQQGLCQQLQSLQHLGRKLPRQRSQRSQSGATTREFARLRIVSMLKQQRHVEESLLKICALSEPRIGERFEEDCHIRQVERVEPPVQPSEVGREEVLVEPVCTCKSAEDVAEVGFVGPGGDLLGPPRELRPNLRIDDLLFQALISQDSQRHRVHLLNIEAATPQTML